MKYWTQYYRDRLDDNLVAKVNAMASFHRMHPGRPIYLYALGGGPLATSNLMEMFLLELLLPTGTLERETSQTFASRRIQIRKAAVVADLHLIEVDQQGGVKEWTP